MFNGNRVAVRAECEDNREYALISCRGASYWRIRGFDRSRVQFIVLFTAYINIAIWKNGIHHVRGWCPLRNCEAPTSGASALHSFAPAFAILHLDAALDPHTDASSTPKKRRKKRIKCPHPAGWPD
jgi:hypothetical protein